MSQLGSSSAESAAAESRGAVRTALSPKTSIARRVTSLSLTGARDGVGDGAADASAAAWATPGALDWGAGPLAELSLGAFATGTGAAEPTAAIGFGFVFAGVRAQ